jgi:hypothetical protein
MDRRGAGFGDADLGSASERPSSDARVDANRGLAPQTQPDVQQPWGEAEELLYDLMVVLFGLRGDAWCAVAAAVPVELQQRIDRYFGLS